MNSYLLWDSISNFIIPFPDRSFKRDIFYNFSYDRKSTHCKYRCYGTNPFVWFVNCAIQSPCSNGSDSMTRGERKEPFSPGL